MIDIATYARHYGDIWAASDSSAFAAMFAPDATYRDDQVGRFSRGHAELEAFHAHFVAAISDIRMEFPRVLRSGNLACLEWTFSGRQTGVYHGRAPTGLSFTGKGVALMELTDDWLIRSVVDYYDSAPVKAQLAKD